MNDKDKKAVADAVLATKNRVENRREKMLEGFQNLQEAIQVIFDNIEDLPDGLAVYVIQDKVYAGMTENGQPSEEALVAARVLWNVPDEGPESIEYEVQLSSMEESETFAELPEVASFIAEPIIEDLIKQQEIKEMVAQSRMTVDPSAPPPDSISAPNDQAAHHVFVYKASTEHGQVIESEISALNVIEAGDKIREAGWTNIEKLELKS